MEVNVIVGKVRMICTEFYSWFGNQLWFNQIDKKCTSAMSVLSTYPVTQQAVAANARNNQSYSFLGIGVVPFL